MVRAAPRVGARLATCWRPALVGPTGRWRALDRRRGTLRGPALLAPWFPPAFWFTATSGMATSGMADSAQGSSPSLGVADRGGDVLLGGGQGVHLKHLAHDAAKAAALVQWGTASTGMPFRSRRASAGAKVDRQVSLYDLNHSFRLSALARRPARQRAPRRARRSCAGRCRGPAAGAAAVPRGGAAAGRPGWWRGSDPARSG